MRDLIERQAAINAVEVLHGGCITNDVKNFVRYQLLSVPSAPRWTPCEERLPEEPFGCIVSYHGFMLTPHGEIEYDAIYPELLGYDGGGWNNSEGECVDNMIDVTAWMPLPKPWKGEDNEM